jgi:hypothetical protein
MTELPGLLLKGPGKLCLAVVFTLLMGCNPSKAQNETKPPPAPTAEALRLATHPGYNTPAGSKQECLGRLVFDVPRDDGMQWGVSEPGRPSGDQFRFTRDLHGEQEYVGVGNISVVVSAPAKRADIERMQRSVGADKTIGIREYQANIEIQQRRVKDIEATIKDPSLNVNGEDLSGFPAAIERIKKDILDSETSIAGMQKDWHPLDLGLPDSLGYAGGSSLHAFLLRDGRSYKFLSTGGQGEPPFEERKRAFLAMLKRFEVRPLHSIPKAPGICIPYGFIPDDGSGHFRINVSMRYADRPGVIYTIGTSVSGERGVDGPEPAGLTATVRAAASILSGGLTAGREVKNLGPRQVKIGALPAWQGGMSLNVAEPGKPPVRSYSVYTGLGGVNHSRVLPNITVDMRSFTKAQEPTLKTEPPPFEESVSRLEELLKSIRLRATDPAMPELAAVPKVTAPTPVAK